MSKRICAVLLFLVSCLVYAQNERVQEPAVATADPLGILIFVLIFFGGMGYFAWTVWRHKRKRNQAEKPTTE